MSVINFGQSISVKEFAHAVSTVGQDVTIIAQGEPGIGKSAMLKEMAKLKPGYQFVYLDCAQLVDQGDLAMPFTQAVKMELLNVDADGEMRITKVAPYEFFKFHTGKPVIIMLDEIGKAIRGVINALLTLMLEKRYREFHLPEGSIVCGTTNLSSDGVGDRMEAHVRNRVAFVTVRKPTKDEWVDWAMGSGVAPEVIAWARFDHKHDPFASYTDPSQRDNPYIFNPTRAGGGAFVTGRSLEKASHVVKQRAVLGDAVTIALLAGLLGEAAARDMPTFFAISDKLPTKEQIANDPENAKLPDDTIARCMLVYGAFTWVTKETLSPVIKYIQRMDKEWQALFCKGIMAIEAKQAFASKNKDLTTWAMANQWLL